MFSLSINNAMFSYLEPNLEPIQRRRAGPRDCPCDSSGDQVAPPHARHDVLLAEVVGDADVLAEVDALKEENAGRCKDIGAPARKRVKMAFHLMTMTETPICIPRRLVQDAVR